MKPRSVISLIVSAVFVLLGIIVCIVASAMAASDGVMLFPKEDNSGNLVYTMELDGISKININSDDADISVVGGAERSYIEVVNFNANYYKLTDSNGSLSFAQIDDFMSMFKFWDNGFSFKGMRYILRMGDDAPGGKKVIVNLADGDSITSINLSSDKGTVSLESCSFDADYTVNAKNGKAEIKDISGAKSLKIYGDKSEITAETCSTDELALNGNAMKTVLRSISAKSSSALLTGGSLEMHGHMSDTLSITTADGSVTIPDYKIGDGEIITTSGAVSVGIENKNSTAVYTTTKNGKISVNGEFKESYSLNCDTPSCKLSVTTESGDITVKHP